MIADQRIERPPKRSSHGRAGALPNLLKKWAALPVGFVALVAMSLAAAPAAANGPRSTRTHSRFSSRPNFLPRRPQGAGRTR